jgi:hypothetical protein
MQRNVSTTNTIVYTDTSILCIRLDKLLVTFLYKIFSTND